MTEDQYRKYKDVWDNLVLTYHGEDNLNERRPDIPLKKVVACITFGKLGFAGHRRFKSWHKGIEVLWKRDAEGKYVVITYYRTQKRRNRTFEKLGII